MYQVNHSFLFRGKRYKEGQLIPDDHAATRYRTQFLDLVAEEDVEAPSASTESSELVEEEKIVQEVKPQVQVPQAQQAPKQVVKSAAPVYVSQQKKG